jgi:hypothetical protein
MELALVIAVVLLASGMLAGTLLVFPAMWQGFRRQWERFPPEARRRGVLGGTLTAAYMVAGSVLSIAAPWGPNTVLYVLGVGGGAVMLLMLAAVAVQAVGATRRAPRRR